MRQVARDDSAKGAYLKDPAAFLEAYDLTDEERKALIAKDFRSLYALGAHSFLLFAFVMSVFPGDRKKIEEQYCKTIEPLGRIDYST
ncbi:MAG: hypothetical protein ACREPG_03440 [Candidatus Binatia bacterium]